MRLRHLTPALLCSMLLSPLSLAAPAELHTDNAFIRTTPPGATNAGAYLDIRVTGEAPAVLTGAHSPASEAVELHVMRMEGETMLMRQVTNIDISEDAPLMMRPGDGYHLMLIDLESPLTEGQTLPITLEFDALDDIDVAFQVAPLSAILDAMDHTQGDHTQH